VCSISVILAVVVFDAACVSSFAADQHRQQPFSVTDTFVTRPTFRTSANRDGKQANEGGADGKEGSSESSAASSASALRSSLSSLPTQTRPAQDGPSSAAGDPFGELPDALFIVDGLCLSTLFKLAENYASRRA
jgi:hypothetical protein